MNHRKANGKRVVLNHATPMEPMIVSFMKKPAAVVAADRMSDAMIQ